MNVTKFVASRREEALLVGDYDTYRAQLTRRLHVVRKRLGIANPKGKKYIPKAPITAENVAKNTEFVDLLLLSSERAWATAMHTKTVHSTDASAKGIVGATRTQVITKLHNATVHASQLVTVLEDREITGATEVDLLEARAYLASLSGAYYLEKQRWEECLAQFSVARIVYDTLAASTKEEVHKDLLSNTIDPSIRYAAYQLRLPRTKAIPSLAAEKFPAAAEQARSEIESLNPKAFAQEASGISQDTESAATELPSHITWRSRKVRLEDAAIAQALAEEAAALPSLAEALADTTKTSRDKAAAYESVISACQDAVESTKTAIDEMAKEGVDPSDSRMQALQITRTAVNFKLIGWRIGRNRVLAGDADGSVFVKEKGKRTTKEDNKGRRLARLRERATLYDGILQSIESAKELPGVAADVELMEELNAQYSYFDALRCLTFARARGISGEPRNALALLSKASELAATAQKGAIQSSDSSAQTPNISVHQDQVRALGQLLEGMAWQHQAIVELEQLSGRASKTSGGFSLPLIEQINEYPAGGVDLDSLVTYPPKMQPIPVKPLFFDVAWNYIEYPGQAETQEEDTQMTEVVEETPETNFESKKRGWFGFGRS